MRAWPDHWPKYWNACTDPCDVSVGPCVCGAWHQPGEFEMEESVLFRYGTEVGVASIEAITEGREE